MRGNPLAIAGLTLARGSGCPAPAASAVDGGPSLCETTACRAIAGTFRLSTCVGCDPSDSTKATAAGELTLSPTPSFSAYRPSPSNPPLFDGRLIGPPGASDTGPVQWVALPGGHISVTLHADQPRGPDQGASFYFDVENGNLRGSRLVNSVAGHRTTAAVFALRVGAGTP